MNRKEMLNEIKSLTARNEQIIAEATAAGQDAFTEQQEREIDENNEKIKKLRADADRLAEHYEAVSYMNGSDGRTIPPEGLGGYVDPNIGFNVDPYPQRSEGGKIKAAVDRTYRGMFFSNWPKNQPLESNGFKDASEFLRALDVGGDPRLNGLYAAVEGWPTSGGFAVPTQFAETILDQALEEGIVRSRATVFPMFYPELKIPAFNGYNHTSALFGGFAGQWLAEGEEANDIDPTLEMMTLRVNVLGIYGSLTIELEQDAPFLSKRFFDSASKAVSFYEDTAYLTGSGVGQPLGALNNPALIVVDPDAEQAAGTITYSNLCNMFARIHPSCLKNAVWIANNTCIPQLTQLTIPIGTAGSHVPVMTGTNGNFEILTRPVLFTEKVPALGSQGDIGLFDLSQYSIGLRMGIYMDTSNAPGWKTRKTSYRILMRADGQGLWSKVITPVNGSTLSWSVVLGAR